MSQRLLMLIRRPMPGAETPLGLSKPRVNRELRAGEVVSVEAHRVPLYLRLGAVLLTEEGWKNLTEAERPAVVGWLRSFLGRTQLDSVSSGHLMRLLDLPTAAEAGAEETAPDSTVESQEELGNEDQGASRGKRKKGHA